jgi:hypothetical protein
MLAPRNPAKRTKNKAFVPLRWRVLKRQWCRQRGNWASSIDRKRSWKALAVMIMRGLTYQTSANKSNERVVRWLQAGFSYEGTQLSLGIISSRGHFRIWRPDMIWSGSKEAEKKLLSKVWGVVRICSSKPSECTAMWRTNCTAWKWVRQTMYEYLDAYMDKRKAKVSWSSWGQMSLIIPSFFDILEVEWLTTHEDTKISFGRWLYQRWGRDRAPRG